MKKQTKQIEELKDEITKMKNKKSSKNISNGTINPNTHLTNPIKSIIL